MVTVLKTGVPTFTSPKSIVVGFTASADAWDPAMDPLPAPQPLMAEINTRVPVASKTGTVFMFLETRGRTANTSTFTFKERTLRNLNISNHLSQKDSACRCEKPRGTCCGERSNVAQRFGWTTCRIDLDDRLVQVTIVTDMTYYDYLCTHIARHCNIYV